MADKTLTLGTLFSADAKDLLAVFEKGQDPNKYDCDCGKTVANLYGCDE